MTGSAETSVQKFAHPYTQEDNIENYPTLSFDVGMKRKLTVNIAHLHLQVIDSATLEEALKQHQMGKDDKDDEQSPEVVSDQLLIIMKNRVMCDWTR